LTNTFAKTEDGNVVKLPADVLAAKYKMEKANAALRADIESPAPTDKARRLTLILELQVATDDYIEKISRLRE
jgi:hypothetical protein